jgi:hypothetical protein
MNKVLLLLLLLPACTDQEMARSFGLPVYDLDLPCGEKLFDISWRDMSLWYATRPMRPGESPETYIYRRDLSFGGSQGTVTIRECE